MARQFDLDTMTAQWNAGDDSVLDRAREIVAGYEAATRGAEARYRQADVAWHASLMEKPGRFVDLEDGTRGWVAADADSAALRDAVVQAKADLDAIAGPLLDDRIAAETFILQIDAASARAGLESAVGLAERISYGEEARP